MTYLNNGKAYEVECVNYGMCIQVNGTTITEEDLTAGTFSVFVEGDEIIFNSFEEAYEFAMTKQKDTCWLEN